MSVSAAIIEQFGSGCASYLAQAAIDTSMLNTERLTVMAVLTFVVVAFLQGWIVPGWIHKAEKERADRWESRCVANLDIVEEALKVASISADNLEKKAA